MMITSSATVFASDNRKDGQHWLPSTRSIENLLAWLHSILNASSWRQNGWRGTVYTCRLRNQRRKGKRMIERPKKVFIWQISNTYTLFSLFQTIADLCCIASARTGVYFAFSIRIGGRRREEKKKEKWFQFRRTWRIEVLENETCGVS